MHTWKGTRGRGGTAFLGSSRSAPRKVRQRPTNSCVRGCEGPREETWDIGTFISTIQYTINLHLFIYYIYFFSFSNKIPSQIETIITRIQCIINLHIFMILYFKGQSFYNINLFFYKQSFILLSPCRDSIVFYQK